MTLQLFDVLISSPLPSVINDLILVHWSGSHQVEYIVLPDKLQEEREGLQKLVEEYLALMPEGLNSCRHVSRDEVGLEQYLVDAHHQVCVCVCVCVSVVSLLARLLHSLANKTRACVCVCECIVFHPPFVFIILSHTYMCTHTPGGQVSCSEHGLE